MIQSWPLGGSWIELPLSILRLLFFFLDFLSSMTLNFIESRLARNQMKIEIPTMSMMIIAIRFGSCKSTIIMPHRGGIMSISISPIGGMQQARIPP